MGKASKLSTFGCIAGVVLLLQLGFHTQLFQRRRGVYDYENLTDKTNQDANDPQFSTSSIQEMKASEPSESHSFVTSSPSISNLADEGNPWEGVSSEFTIENYYSGNFTYPNPDLCKNKNNLTILVLVPSTVSNFIKRQSVRRTWGSFGARRDVAIGFVIGNPNLSNVNETILEKLQSEIDLFGDIIIADFKDSYRNLTLKTLFMVDWASRYCSARFYMKTDDDVFLNFPLLLNFISKIQESDLEQPKIYGMVYSGHLPKRNVSHKHFINYTIYPYEIQYPNFTSGPAYLISFAVLKPLLKQAVRLPLFNLEDVLLNGFAASALGIPRVHVEQFHNEEENPFDMPVCKLVEIIAGMTDGSQRQMYQVWSNYLMGTITCENSLRR